MRSKLFKFALVATLWLALASTFSCTIDLDDDGSSSSSSGLHLISNLNPNINQNSNISVPATPTGLMATASSNTIIVTWNPVAGAAGYVLYYSNFPDFSKYGYEIVSGTSYIESDIPPGTYYFVLTAYNANEDESDLSNIVFTTVTGGSINPSSSSGNNTSGLAAPTGLRATASSNTVTVTWNPVAGAAGYVLYYSTSPYFDNEDDDDNHEIVSGTFYTEEDVPPGTYYFAVTAYNANFDESNPSNVVPVTVTGGTPGPTPGPGTGFSSVADMKTWLTAQPDNTPSTPYTITLNVSNLAGIKKALTDNPTKYVILNLSGSTFPTIDNDTFGSSVSSVGYRALTLVGIIIPNTVTSIGANAFYGCASLNSIDIPNTVNSIGNNAFAASGLREVTIGNGVTSIGNSAFDNCKNLISVTIPSSVTTLGTYAFRGCTSLTSVTFAPNSRITIIGGNAFNGCTSLTSVIIPNSVTSIGGSAFAGCTSLANVIIGSSVTSVEGYAFTGCTSLATVRFEGNEVATFGYSSFINTTATTNLQSQYKVFYAGTYTRSANNWTKLD